MGQALTAASAPRIGVPGPGPLGLIGLGGGAFGQGYQGHLARDAAHHTAALQAQLLQQQVASGQAATAQAQARILQNKNLVAQNPALANYLYTGPSTAPTTTGATVLSATPPVGPFSLPAPGGPQLGTAPPPPAALRAQLLGTRPPVAPGAAPGAPLGLPPPVAPRAALRPPLPAPGAAQRVVPGITPGVAPYPGVATFGAPAPQLQRRAVQPQIVPRPAPAATPPPGPPASMFDKMPLNVVRLLAGRTDRPGLANMAKQWLEDKAKPRFGIVESPYGMGGKAMRDQYGNITGYQKPPEQFGIGGEFGGSRLNRNTGAWEQQNLQTGRWVPMPKAASNLEVTFDKDGRITGITQGPPKLMTPKTRGNVEKKLMDADAGMTRMNTIVAGWRPEYNTLQGRLKLKWHDVREKYLGQNLNQTEMQELTAFSGWQRDAIEDINLYIKEITGAQMSENEADRIRLAKADPGEGVLPKDGPTAFKAKLEAAYRSLEIARARYGWYLKNGITDYKVMEKRSPLSSLKVWANKDGDRVMKIQDKWVPM